MSYPAIPLVELEEGGERLSGVFPDMPISEYHSSLALSNSGVGRLLRSPAHYKVGFGDPTPSMALGSAVHALVLEPHLDLVPIPPSVPKRSKADKATWAAFEATLKPNSVLLSAKDYDRARYMAAAVTSNADVQRMGLLEGAKETSFFGTDKNGCYRRARADIWTPDIVIVTDLKTTTDASEAAFRRSVGQFGYHRQVPFYQDTMDLCGVATCDFVFLAVESSEPYGVAVYGLDEATIEQGRRENERAAKLWASCTESGNWHSYPEGVGMLVLPAWLRDADFDQ